MTDTIHHEGETHCPYCALQCGMSLVAEAGRLVVAPRDFPTNKGGLCRKGFTPAELLDARALPFPLEDIPGAAAVLLVGGNPADTMPPLMQYFEEQRRRGGKLIVVDPRRSATAKLASLHLQITPGTDAALANGLLNVAISHRLIDDEFIAARTSGFDRVRRIVTSYWPDRVERITGVPARKIE